MVEYMSEKIWPKGVRWGGAGLVSRGRVARIGRDAERVVRVFDTSIQAPRPDGTAKT